MILDTIFGVENRHTGGLVVTGAGVGQDATLNAVFGPRGQVTAGVDVTEETPMTLSGWYAAVRLLAWTLASVPLRVYQRKDNDDREKAPEHPVYRVLHTEPNPDMTAMVCRELGFIHVILWGNAYLWIERNGAGQVAAIWPLDPACVQVNRWQNGRRLAYDISRLHDAPTAKKVLMSEEVVHVPGLGFNGIQGKSVVGFAAEHVGESVQANRFAAGRYAAGHRPDLYIKHPRKMHNRKSFRDRWKDVHGSAVPEIPVLDEGMEMGEVPAGMPMKDLQYIEARQFLVTDAARWIGLPPHKIADLVRATFSNIAEQNIEFKESLTPWAERFEQEYDRKLFSQAEQEQYYTEHTLEALLQGDPVGQAQAFSIDLQNGTRNRNEVRRLRNLNGMGPEGDIFTVQTNLQKIEKLGEEPEAQPIPPQLQGPPVTEDDSDQDSEEEDADDRSRLLLVQRAWLEDALRNMVRREVMELRTAAREPGKFLDRLAGLYERFPEKARGYIDAAVATARDAGIEADRSIVDEHCRTAHAAMLELSGTVKAAELAARVEAETQRWIETLPSQLANQAILGGNE